jgi:hypothetical protein
MLHQHDADYAAPELPFPLLPPALEAEWAKNGPPAFGASRAIVCVCVCMSCVCVALTRRP